MYVYLLDKKSLSATLLLLHEVPCMYGPQAVIFMYVEPIAVIPLVEPQRSRPADPLPVPQGDHAAEHIRNSLLEEVNIRIEASRDTFP